MSLFPSLQPRKQKYQDSSIFQRYESAVVLSFDFYHFRIHLEMCTFFLASHIKFPTKNITNESVSVLLLEFFLCYIIELFRKKYYVT